MGQNGYIEAVFRKGFIPGVAHKAPAVDVAHPQDHRKKAAHKRSLPCDTQGRIKSAEETVFMGYRPLLSRRFVSRRFDLFYAGRVVLKPEFKQGDSSPMIHQFQGGHLVRHIV